MLDVLQNHYPERMHRIYVVNAPVLFWGLWNIVKPFVDPNTKAKLQFVSSMEHAVEKDQAMPYQRADGELTHPVDANEFFNLPFDRAYDEPIDA
jgi:CRAL/TRIO domain